VDCSFGLILHRIKNTLVGHEFPFLNSLEWYIRRESVNSQNRRGIVLRILSLYMMAKVMPTCVKEFMANEWKNVSLMLRW
jgi:hypothetical protein